MKLNILTPLWNRELEADAVFIPGSYAPFEILPNHAPTISTLTEGTVRWRSDGKEESISVKRGVVRVNRNEIHICAEL